MAVAPYFVISPNTLLSLVGFLRGSALDEIEPSAAWRDARVDVLIPALNEERTIVLCLDSLLGQTLQPHRVVLVDDGSSDRTVELCRQFSEANGLDIDIVRRAQPIGKTPSVKEGARRFDADIEFVLDADTVLVSDDYIERTVREFYKDPRIASVCGFVLPMRENDRAAMAGRPRIAAFLKNRGDVELVLRRHPLHRLARRITNVYRDALYYFLQQFVYRGQMALYGTIINPVGCAVAYRRGYLRGLFDRYEPILGDDLTFSEDIFIGFAFLEQGYRNVQIPDVFVRSEEPEAQQVPRQIFMWSSAFLQSCYYFPELVLSPFKVFKRRAHARTHPAIVAEDGLVDTSAESPEAQIDFTRRYGRAIGWAILLSAVEKISFPFVLLAMILLNWWQVLGLTIAAETAVQVLLVLVFAKGRRMEHIGKGLIATPLRYGSMMFDLVTITRFFAEILFVREHHWRK